jgi:hypothetical protein
MSTATPSAVTATAAGRSSWFFVLVAVAILMLTMGSRQSLGLFCRPSTPTRAWVLTASVLPWPWPNWCGARCSRFLVPWPTAEAPAG